MYILKDYDTTLHNIINRGHFVPSRGGNTLSIMGAHCRYNISEYFPIPTRRKVYYKSIFVDDFRLNKH